MSTRSNSFDAKLLEMLELVQMMNARLDNIEAQSAQLRMKATAMLFKNVMKGINGLKGKAINNNQGVKQSSSEMNKSLHIPTEEEIEKKEEIVTTPAVQKVERLVLKQPIEVHEEASKLLSIFTPSISKGFSDQPPTHELTDSNLTRHVDKHTSAEVTKVAILKGNTKE